MSESRRISPTAHYTSWVWYRHGLSPRALSTATGRLFFAAADPFNRLASRLLGGLTLERMLLQRHRLIDHLLDQAIAAGATQVLELAAGLSGRGLRTLERHGRDGITTYVEADLPDMARRKRARLRRSGLLAPGHHVVSLDILNHDGVESFEAVADGLLDRGSPTVLITEGLVDYFDPHTIAGAWRRWATWLSEAGGGVYLSDLHLEAEAPRSVLIKAFRQALGAATGGRVLQTFHDATAAGDALRRAGFSEVTLHRPSDFYDRLDIPRLARPTITRVIEARVG